MNKLNFLLSVLLFFCLNAVAQVPADTTYYIKKNVGYVKNKDSADYKRVVTASKSGNGIYQVNDYYMNGKKKSIGQTRMDKRMIYEGPYVSYYQNGNKEKEGNYVNDELEGEVTTYYPNGKLYTTIVYKKEGTPVQRSEYIKTVKDMKGKNLVVNGKGKYLIYGDDFKEVTDEGSVSDGVYDGIWTGKNTGEKSTYSETYANGKLISGKSIDDKGKSYDYTELLVSPEFVGGQKALSLFLGRNIKYPSKCQEEGIQGTVLLSFKVLKTGEVINVRVTKKVHPELDREALRVVKRSPLWKTGYYRGVPSDLLCNLPVRFVLD
ncbi:TonB family protein [Pedobacter caeni]|uniref:TonB family C-terminal domain-containing protein n=1 Tax=Pedobacter caeni TaxID=288992 RepID=A0A1M5B5I7_9SPHI|nr:TonB family protein [Pedobacter caeni]SHF37784.1 TonB family C-terminal domain-containing protein [Pedobacter caeni]